MTDEIAKATAQPLETKPKKKGKSYFGQKMKKKK
jgi:hypothetical protein